ncbi:phage holin family protein [Emticicia fluvialis]|uniref:phage holin family protein n=1 Tax=Emticicia fluvialis TaxID=2974474 RepID=UPI0021654BCC|nr:phage holin family protein [Emticicia fluvialis]
MADFLNLSDFRDNVIRLIEAKFELTKLGFQEKIEGIAVKAIYLLVLFILSITVIIFLSILAAIGLNIWLKSLWLGYLIIFLVYAGILALFVFARDRVQNKIKEQVQQIVDENLNNMPADDAPPEL